MKTLLSALFVASLTALVHACPPGSTEYEGNCVVEIRPESAPRVVPSDEKPPRDKMPSYQREGVKVIELPSLIAMDSKQDSERDQAIAEGKKAAGIR